MLDPSTHWPDVPSYEQLNQGGLAKAIRIQHPNPRFAIKPTKVKLYHGTSAEAVPGIISTGLAPRSLTGKNNYGTQGLPSLASNVYLGTREYVFYAFVAAYQSDEPHRMAVIEVELDSLDFDNLYPNEDAIWSVLKQDGFPDFQEMHRVPAIRMCHASVEENKDLWFEYLLTQASVAHRGVIAPNLISRVSIFESNLILHDLFYEEQSTAAEKSGVLMTLEEGSYDAVRKWMFTGEITKGAIDHLKSDAKGKGYKLSNMSRWPQELELIRKQKPFVFTPSTIRRSDRELINKLARPLTSSRIGSRPLWPDGIPTGR